ncbi:hypothetical protein F9L07_25210 [Pimelobacter simplex]|uniref:Uncharacterized protein n=1 Tax=Nocardioides simplex TaxID=2045 RepID=A0A7J5DT65_NOCSI|nr:hypothetical protein [Pimelobacter simplex]KAB2807971.1 hypothetical protein F9L07_25210 [Pimelobacter simplex]
MAIGINIGGEQISAAVVRDSLDDLLVLLGEASKASGVGRQDWKISELRVGSAVLAVGAPDETSVAALLRAGIDGLERVAAVPAGWNRRMVERLRDMGQRVGHGGATRMTVTGLAGADLLLSPEVVVNAERALGADSVSYGSFRGTADRWNEHGKREIGLDLDGFGSVRVTYPAALAEQVREQALGRRIEVWGLVGRNPAGQPTGITMEGFEVLPKRQVVPVSEVAGIFADEDGSPWFGLDEWMASRGE